MRITKEMFAPTLISLWLKTYPDYERNLALLGQEKRKEHFDRVKLSYEAAIDAVIISMQNSKRWPFRFKEWLSYILDTGLTPVIISKKCRAPVSLVRLAMSWHGLIKLDSVRKKIKWIVSGDITFENDSRCIAFKEQIGFEDWIFVKTYESDILLPVDMVLRGESSGYNI